MFAENTRTNTTDNTAVVPADLEACSTRESISSVASTSLLGIVHWVRFDKDSSYEICSSMFASVSLVLGLFKLSCVVKKVATLEETR